MKFLGKSFLSLLLLLLCFESKAQLLDFSHEIGAFVGPVAFQSDFGERHNFPTNAGNSGFGIGLVHYMNFSYTAGCPSCKKTYTFWNDHFKVRSEFSYNSTKLDHFGQWVDDSKTSVFAKQLRAMHGVAKVTDLGMQLEYYPMSIRDFESYEPRYAPFVAIGAHYTWFQNGTYSDIGPMNNTFSTPTKYMNAWSDTGGNTWSVVSSVGSRYKLNDMSDLFVELRWQYYFSDWVDGLKPNPEVYKENKANDWNLWLNFGYIYYLD
jgi:hypothetical protein